MGRQSSSPSGALGACPSATCATQPARGRASAPLQPQKRERRASIRAPTCATAPDAFSGRARACAPSTIARARFSRCASCSTTTADHVHADHRQHRVRPAPRALPRASRRRARCRSPSPSAATSAPSASITTIASAPAGLWPTWCSGRPRSSRAEVAQHARGPRTKLAKRAYRVPTRPHTTRKATSPARCSRASRAPGASARSRRSRRRPRRRGRTASGRRARARPRRGWVDSRGVFMGASSGNADVAFAEICPAPRPRGRPRSSTRRRPRAASRRRQPPRGARARTTRSG